MYFRWLVLAVFILSSGLNYLDRGLLGAFAPDLLREFQLTPAEFGNIGLIFNLVYAISSPIMGWMVDRLGLTWGTSLLVACWSTVGIFTGFANTLVALMVCRGLLGFFESGGIPSSSKTIATYLRPEERAFGSALSQVGITLGMSAAPQWAAFAGPRFGWQTALMLAGAAGFLWIPLWWLVCRTPPPSTALTTCPTSPQPQQKTTTFSDIARDRRIWILALTNILAMTGYSLWSDWRTLFLVREFGLTQQVANAHFAWIPPIFATLGGFAGGIWAWRSIRKNDPIPARIKIFGIAVLPLATSLVTIWAPTPHLATAGMSICLFFTVMASVNLYALPLDLFPAQRAAFAISILTAAYGISSAIWSRVVGQLVTNHQFPVAIGIAALLPLLSWVILRLGLSSTSAEQ
jgi:MFS transporter, ACS family, hexuronate transporter